MSSETAADTRSVDLHVHTTASDGDLTPAQCVDEAARQGLAAIAVTDHDTVAGNAEALARGAEVGVEVVPGVEISVDHPTLTVHLLGYYPDPAAPEFRAVLDRLQHHREVRNPSILERLAELGCPLDYAEVMAIAGGGVVGRPHIAAAMIRRRYVGTLNEAFDRYLAKGAPAYVGREKPTPEAAILAMLGARAVPVLAHPGAMGARSIEEVEALVVSLADAGLRGIEALYHACTRPQADAYTRLARRHGLLVTGGTDFHSADRPGVPMGGRSSGLSLPYELLAHVKSMRDTL